MRRWPLSILCFVCSLGLAIFAVLWQSRDACFGFRVCQDVVAGWSAVNVLRSDEGDWHLLYHLGGNGPWIKHQPNGSEYDTRLPQYCKVDQVHMIARHAERYPTLNAGKRHLALMDRLRSHENQLKGSLSFFKGWQYFVSEKHPEFENLTTTGRYAGTLQAYNTGQKLRPLYHHLLPKDRATNFWTCSSPRDIETAKHFGRGFFGHDWESHGIAELHIISESGIRGGDTLTPGRSCRGYRQDRVNGRDMGYTELAKFQEVVAHSVKARLRDDLGGLDLTALEIYGMMELCGFDLMVRGDSPWCDVFTQDEWLQYEYARDLLHFYRAGPGNLYAGAMGWLWLDATQEQMNNRSATGVYFSFVHDGDIIPLLTTLGLLSDGNDANFLPSDRVKHDRSWRTSDIVPMGGRLLFEKVLCIDPAQPMSETAYVRLFMNDALFDLGHLVAPSTLKHAVELKQFQHWVHQRGKEVGDFHKICGLGADVPSRISFFHQP